MKPLLPNKEVRTLTIQQSQTLNTEFEVEKFRWFPGRAPSQENRELVLKIQLPDVFNPCFYRQRLRVEG